MWWYEPVTRTRGVPHPPPARRAMATVDARSAAWASRFAFAGMGIALDRIRVVPCRQCAGAAPPQPVNRALFPERAAGASADGEARRGSYASHLESCASSYAISSAQSMISQASQPPADSAAPAAVAATPGHGASNPAAGATPTPTTTPGTGVKRKKKRVKALGAKDAAAAAAEAGAGAAASATAASGADIGGNPPSQTPSLDTSLASGGGVDDEHLYGYTDADGRPVASSSSSPPPPLRRAVSSATMPPAASSSTAVPATPAVAFGTGPSPAAVRNAQSAAAVNIKRAQLAAAEVARKKRSGWLLVTNEQSASTWRKIVWRELYCSAGRNGINIYKHREDSAPYYVIPITEIEVVGRTSEGVGGRKFCFTVVGHDFQYYFQARNDEHCGEWCGFLTTLLAQNMDRIVKSRKATGRTPLPDKATAAAPRGTPGHVNGDSPAGGDASAPARGDAPATARKPRRSASTPAAAKRRSQSAPRPQGPPNPLDPKKNRPME